MYKKVLTWIDRNNSFLDSLTFNIPQNSFKLITAFDFSHIFSLKCWHFWVGIQKLDSLYFAQFGHTLVSSLTLQNKLVSKHRLRPEQAHLQIWLPSIVNLMQSCDFMKSRRLWLFYPVTFSNLFSDLYNQQLTATYSVLDWAFRLWFNSARLSSQHILQLSRKRISWSRLRDNCKQKFRLFANSKEVKNLWNHTGSVVRRTRMRKLAKNIDIKHLKIELT